MFSYPRISLLSSCLYACASENVWCSIVIQMEQITDVIGFILAVEIWLFYVLASCYSDDNDGGWVGSIPAKESSSSS